MKVFPKTALRRQDAFFLFSRLVPSKCCFQHPVFWLEDRVILDRKVGKIFHYWKIFELISPNPPNPHSVQWPVSWLSCPDSVAGWVLSWEPHTGSEFCQSPHSRTQTGRCPDCSQLEFKHENIADLALSISHQLVSTIPSEFYSTVPVGSLWSVWGHVWSTWFQTLRDFWAAWRGHCSCWSRMRAG